MNFCQKCIKSSKTAKRKETRLTSFTLVPTIAQNRLKISSPQSQNKTILSFFKRD